MAGIDNNTLLYLRGDSTNDLSLNPKTITNNGVTVSNNQLEFNRSELDSLYFDSLHKFTNSTPFTVEFNLNLSSIPSTSEHVITNTIDGTRTHSVTVTVVSGKITICLGSNNSNLTSGRDLFSSTKTLAINTWYHIAVTYNGIDNIKVYIDGVCTDAFTRTKNIETLDNNWCIGNNKGTNKYPFDGYLKNFRISNVARYTKDFTPPTKAFNSISINVTNQTRDKIDFNISKLGQEVVNKVELLVNNQVSKTYASIGDLTYNIDKSLCIHGINKLKIKVTFDNDYTEEKEITFISSIDKISTTSSLKELIDRQEELTNSIEVQKNTLKSILESKNVDVSEGENKLSILIDKVNGLGDYEPRIVYLYKDGDECVSSTGGWSWFTSGYGSTTYYNGEKQSNCLYMKVTKGAVKCITPTTTNAIDLTKYSKLYIELSNNIKAIDNQCMQTFKVRSSKNTSGTVAHCNISTTGLSTNYIDISNLNGNYYITYDTYINGSFAQSYLETSIYKIWLEK